MKLPKFSLRFLLILITFLATNFGIVIYFNPDIDLFGFIFLTVVNPAWLGISYWILSSTSWRYRVAFFVAHLGAWLEFTAIGYWHDNDMIVYKPNSYETENWYPFCLPIEKLLVRLSLANYDDPNLHVGTIVCSMVLTGILTGIMVLIIWNLIANRYRGVNQTNQ